MLILGRKVGTLAPTYILENSWRRHLLVSLVSLVSTERQRLADVESSDSSLPNKGPPPTAVAAIEWLKMPALKIMLSLAP